jgi:hypothetical protein
MNEMEFHAKLGELIKHIGELPEDRKGEIEELATQTRERHDKMRQTISDLQESLDYLRLSIKYLVFDLEATRRENDYLRKLLEANNSRREGDAGHED